MIHTYQEKATITNLKKTYSILSQTFRQAIDEHGSVDTWCTTNEKETLACDYKIYDMISHYVKGSLIKTDYRAAVYKLRNGSKLDMYTSDDTNAASTHFKTKPFVLHNGTYLWIQMNGDANGCYAETSEKTTYRWGGTCGWITVDLNGSNSGPNLDGADVFGFTIFTDGIAPQGTSYDNYWYPFSFEGQCAGQQVVGWVIGRCTAWVLENNNLDYLKCPEKLGWDKALKCPK